MTLVLRTVHCLKQAIPNLVIIVHSHHENCNVPYKRDTILANMVNEDLHAGHAPASHIAVPPSMSINGIIFEAVNDHKGVHPNHGGELIQYGWNAGLHHLHVFGLVNNLIHKQLTGDEHQQKNKAILSVLAPTWNLLTKTLLEEVIVPVKEAIEAAGIPPMVSKDDVKAPAKAYMSQNDTACVAFFPIHQDTLYAPYALNWATENRVYDHKLVKIRKECSSGDNYMDASLRVVCLHPEFKHEITLARPSVWHQGTAINFSTHQNSL
ncbi:hypothetical protein V8B97DRAFT_2025038 [Scleroderma yunnanense]